MPRNTLWWPRRGRVPVPSAVSGAEDTMDEEVEELDADERRDQPAEAVDEQVASQQRRRPQRPVADAAQGERDEQRDDQRVEDDGSDDRRLWRAERHDVEPVERAAVG